MKVTAPFYGQFLVNSQVNCTGTCLAGHLDGSTHDNVSYSQNNSHLTLHQLWQQVRPQVALSARDYVLFNDTVLDKRHSRRIELVRRQHSGNAHGVISAVLAWSIAYTSTLTPTSFG